MRNIYRPLLGLALGIGVIGLSGCEKKLEKEQCNLVRKKAFDLRNEAQPCSTDQDCVNSVWPDCHGSPNKKTFDAITPIQKEFTDGKCEEPKADCKVPEVYCKQGLCVVREKGTTGTDEIQIN
jgi:hypothetical protein